MNLDNEFGVWEIIHTLIDSFHYFLFIYFHFNSRIVLLNKLLEDGNVLYRKNRLQDASHRYEYALKKIPSGYEKSSDATDDAEEIYGHNNTFQQLKFNFLINLSRCKRKMNVSRLNFIIE